jgi:AmmeMemoRadiSam system protein B
MLSRTYLLPLLLLALLAGAVAVQAATPLSYRYADFRRLIGREQVIKSKIKSVPLIGITSHHLPTASPLIDRFYGQLQAERPDIKTFVVVGPDHFEKCRLKQVTTRQNIGTMFGDLVPDLKLSAQIVQSGIRLEDDCFYGEHAIGVQANYIKKYFPKAQVVPILLSYSAKKFDFSKLTLVLKNNRRDIFVVESTDFTHYVNVASANAVDRRSQLAINQLEGQGFTLKQIDSPASIKLILGLAKKENLQPTILEHQNSFDFNGQAENTTSYFSVLFR